jgi:hypothetical protein
MERLETIAAGLGYLQANRIRADIDSSKGRHDAR